MAHDDFQPKTGSDSIQSVCSTLVVPSSPNCLTCLGTFVTSCEQGKLSLQMSAWHVGAIFYVCLTPIDLFFTCVPTRTCVQEPRVRLFLFACACACACARVRLFARELLLLHTVCSNAQTNVMDLCDKTLTGVGNDRRTTKACQVSTCEWV